jgi:hypothetical protein
MNKLKHYDLHDLYLSPGTVNTNKSHVPSSNGETRFSYTLLVVNFLAEVTWKNEEEVNLRS